MVISDIKKTLIQDIDKLIEVLEHYNYANIKIHTNYISFGRDENSSPKSIVIRTVDNDNIYVKDYPQNINADIFEYIMSQRGVSFSDILNVIKKVLGITTTYENYYKPKCAFGGWYNKIRINNTVQCKTYDESLLDKYEKVGNEKFLKDHISLETQKFFGVGYDEQSNAITIPIRTEVGSLMGIKARCNYDLDSVDFQKYYFVVPCLESETLFGYYHNYRNLVNNDIYIFESEKSVMQCRDYGLYNAVALGSGSISNKQIQLILYTNPKRVIFMHDNEYQLKAIKTNISKLRDYSIFNRSLEIGYWDFTTGNWPYKCSPSDLSKDDFYRIINKEISFDTKGLDIL